MKKLKQILIIDDDPIHLRLMMSILCENYKISVAKSAAAAITLLSKTKFDLILLDYMMPICDGPQTLKMIRAEESTKDIPVMFLTGVNEIESVKSALSLKIDGYILKSTPPHEILSRIGEFFDKNETK